MTKLEHRSAEEIAGALVEERIDVNALNLAGQSQRDGFLLALQKRPYLLSKIEKTNLEHFVPVALKKNPEWFLYLKKDQYTTDFIVTYLIWRLEKDVTKKRASNANAADKDFFHQKSYDDKLVFTYNYVSPEADALYYEDQELGIPLSIRSSFKILLKMEDGESFLKKMDVAVETLGRNKITTVLKDLLASRYKMFLYKFLKDNKLGYYSLCISVNRLEKEFIAFVDKELQEYGLAVTEFIVQELSIPKALQNKVEDLAFQSRQQYMEAQANATLAKMSLESYKEKLELQHKYPDAVQSLTEYEKDQALRRYLIKKGVEPHEELDRTISIRGKKEETDDSIVKNPDIVPEVQPKVNVFKRAFITWLIISLAISLIVLISNRGVGFIFLGVTTLIFGLIAAFNHKKFSDVPVEVKKEETSDGANDNKQQ